MQSLYVVGGEQKDQLESQDEWHIHRAGKIAWIDPSQRAAECLVEYQSPAAYCPDRDPSFLLKSSTLFNNRLYTCSSTEVLIFDAVSFKLLQRISHACFNDLHHVNVAPNGWLFVANTGLDSVVEMYPDGTIRRHWSVLTWHRCLATVFARH